MQYTEFKRALRDELPRHPAGLTWAELKTRLRLPYERPCPTWVKQLEREIGLKRIKGSGKAKIWLLKSINAGVTCQRLNVAPN